MNRIFMVGNITGDIYFDRFLMHSRQRSFLRLILMAERPRAVRGMRVVLWDEKAELYFPYLKKGSELAVIGQFESRMHKGKWVHEVVSENLLLLRKINWEYGERIRSQYNLSDASANTSIKPPFGESNDVFVVGQVLEDIHLDWRQSVPERGGEYACLRLRLQCGDEISGLYVTVYGSLAELAYPYLQVGSKVAVDGYLRSHEPDKGVTRVDLIVRNMTFLENINWAAGEATRQAPSGGAHQNTEIPPSWVQVIANGD